MAKPTIVTRAGKGSALTWTEGDANITNLQTAAVPDGGAAGEYLVKNSATNWDFGWTDRVTAKTIYENVKNVSGGSLAKGTPVYQVGIAGAATVTVSAARADDPAKLAIGVLDETIADEAEGTMTILGEIKGVNTSGFTVGDPVYLGATGGFTNVAPTSSTVAVQFLGVVFRVDATTGSGFITGTLTPDMVKFNGTSFELWDGDSWVAISSGGGGDLVDDTTPQLGGNLDVNGFSITSASNANVEIAPNGTGDVLLSADTVIVGDVSAAATITTNGSGNLTLNTNSGTNSGSIAIAQGTNANITITTNGTGSTLFNSQAIAIRTNNTNGSIIGRAATTTSSAYNYPGLVAQKHRTDILTAAMTVEPAVIGFSTRDSANVNTNFGRLSCTYQGTGTNPFYRFSMSPDGFTTNVDCVSFGGARAIWGNSTTNYTHTTIGTGSLILDTNQGTDTGNITITAGLNGNITIAPNGTGRVLADKITASEIDNSSSVLIKAGSAFTSTLAQITVSSLGIDLNPDVGQYLLLDGSAWPSSNFGTNGQILSTNGAGTLAWKNAGLDNVVEDTTPQLGGNLDTNGHAIVGTGAAPTLSTDDFISVNISGLDLYAASGRFIDLTTVGANTIVNRNDGAASGAPCLAIRRKRTDTTLASMDNVNSNLTFQVRDNTDATSSFVRFLSNYRTSGSHSITLQTSSDNFSTQTNILNADTGNLRLGPSAGTSTSVLTTNRAGNITISTNNGTNSGTIAITAGANGAITLTPNGSGKVVLSTDVVNITETKTPASASATGTTGDIAWDADYIYVCTATDTWKRTAIATWP